MDLKARDTLISHAMRAPAPAALTAKVPASAPSGAGGARLAIAADPTHLLTDLSLGDIQRLIASADRAVDAALASPAAPAAPSTAAVRARPAAPGRSPWAWLWAVWESVAALYVAFTEPQRRNGQGRAG